MIQWMWMVWEPTWTVVEVLQRVSVLSPQKSSQACSLSSQGRNSLVVLFPEFWSSKRSHSNAPHSLSRKRTEVCTIWQVVLEDWPQTLIDVSVTQALAGHSVGVLGSQHRSCRVSHVGPEKKQMLGKEVTRDTGNTVRSRLNASVVSR